MQHRKRPAAVKAVIFLLASLAGPAHAALQKQALIELTNDRSRETSRLSAIVDNESFAKGLEIATLNGPGQAPKLKAFSLSQIASPQGAVLAEAEGHNAVILYGRIDPKRGGSATLRYLRNGLTNEYADCRTAVRRSTEGKWQIVNSYTGRAVTQAHVQTWSMGISAIRGLCPIPKFQYSEETRELEDLG